MCVSTCHVAVCMSIPVMLLCVCLYPSCCCVYVYTHHVAVQVVRNREGLQCTGDGPAGAEPRGSIQLLLETLYSQDCAHAG